MAEHVWKIGDWCEWNGVRRLVFDVDDEQLETVRNIGGTKSIPIGLAGLIHLPDCTGWYWQPTPKLQLREGAWYERQDGEIVGPCEKLDTTTVCWFIGSKWYRGDGTTLGICPKLTLIREVPAPAPKYRPFANAAEFKPHRDRWIRDKNNWAVRVNSLSHDGANGSSWHSLVNHWTFEDTGLPVGVEVQS